MFVTETQSIFLSNTTLHLRFELFTFQLNLYLSRLDIETGEWTLETILFFLLFYSYSYTLCMHTHST